MKCNHFQQHYIHHFTFISTFICPFTFNFTWLSWAAIIFNNIASTTSLSFCSRKLDLQRTVDKFKLDFYSPSPSLARDINLRYWIWRADYFQHFSWSVGRKDGWDQSANQISQSFTNLLFFYFVWVMQIADGLSVPFPDLNFHFGWPGGLVDAVTLKIVRIFSFWLVLPFPHFPIMNFHFREVIIVATWVSRWLLCSKDQRFPCFFLLQN